MSKLLERLAKTKIYLTAQKGFSLLELLLYASIVGVLLSFAVPKFTGALTTANTVKVQADLEAIDTAITIYYVENGSYPSSVSDLKDYLKDIDSVKPPTGKVNVGSVVEIKSTSYEISLIDGEARATLDGRTAADYGKKD